ncbi:hypothetical protein ACFLWZ_07895 [Chloroflexota bacterium]
MGKSGNTLLLLFGPAMTVVGIDFLSPDVFRGRVIILVAVFVTVVASYYQWVEPKSRNKLWLIFPGLFTAVGYIPLMVLRKRRLIFDRLSRGFESSKSTDSWDTFTLVAAKITKYYLELTRNYKDRLNDEVNLLASAGLLAAQDYIERTISPAQIIDIAKKAVLGKEEVLVDFIINLEIELFKIDVPEFDVSEIEEACFEKRVDIEHVVSDSEKRICKRNRICFGHCKSYGIASIRKF